MSLFSGALVTPNSLVVTHNGTTVTVAREHKLFDKIKDAVREKDYQTAIDLSNASTAINAFGQGRVQVNDGVVTFDGEVLTGQVVEHINRLIEDGFDATPMLNFLENLMQNPSKRAVDELYGFISAAKIAITDDGHLLAYKKVKRKQSGSDELVDIYTGKMDNSVGVVVEMPRNKVNEDKNQTCSQGLHFCSHSYLSHYSGGANDVVVIVKINPRDVVSIPTDYNNAKGRACRYEVVAIHPKDDYSEIFDRAVMNVDELDDDYVTNDYDDGYDYGYDNGSDGELVDYDHSRSEEWRNGYFAGLRQAQEDSSY